jgi:alpha-L-fucosidase
MTKIGWAAAVLAAGVWGSAAAVPQLPKTIFNESPAQRAERLSWWTHDRFGLFIHFGLYAAPARHEWVKSREGLSDAAYDRYLAHFNPDLFDAKEWARAAKAAGMKYAVLTTKHHEGFCLWDAKTTDYKITRTAFGRDFVREFVDAFRAEGLRIGFYYSIIDWRHPDFTIDSRHPLYKRLPPGATQDERVRKANRGRDMARYRKYMFAQVEELLTRYGRIDIVWFDYVAKGAYGKSWRDYDSVNLVRLARRLQPGCIIDSRLDLMDTDDGWDFVTPEQIKVAAWPTVRGRQVPWETCQTFSGSWGYYRDETTWKNMPQLIELLSETVSKGGNLILNVGPTARGVFDARATERLNGFAAWMKYNSRSIYGCTAAPAEFVPPNGTALTYNPKTKALYVHLYDYPMGFLPLAFYQKVSYAQFLHDGSELKIRAPQAHHGQSGDVRPVGGLALPVLKPDVVVPVVELFL